MSYFNNDRTPNYQNLNIRESNYANLNNRTSYHSNLNNRTSYHSNLNNRTPNYSNLNNYIQDDEYIYIDRRSVISDNPKPDYIKIKKNEAIYYNDFRNTR